MQDQHCIIVADVSNPHQHAQPRVLRHGPMGLRRGPSRAWGLGRQAINYARRSCGQVCRDAFMSLAWGLMSMLGQLPPNLKKRRFFEHLLVKAWQRLPRRWETKPGHPPNPPPSPAFGGWKGERKRVLTLSAYGNHPTGAPRSADFYIC